MKANSSSYALVKRILTLVTVIAIALMATPVALAESEGGNLSFRHLLRGDGLLHDNVTCITQDQQGFLWIGTHRGINRYDGYRLESFRYTEDPTDQVYVNRVISLLPVDRILWFTCEKGLRAFDMRSMRYLPIQATEANKEALEAVQKIEAGPTEGTVWLISRGMVRLARLSVADSPTLSWIADPYSTVSTDPTVASDSAGHTWIAGNPNIDVYSFNPASSANTFVANLRNVSGDGVRAMLASKGALWVATAKEVKRYRIEDDGSLSFTASTPVSTTWTVNGMVATPQGVYVSAPDGVSHLDPESAQVLSVMRHDATDITSVGSDINGIYADRNSTLWVSGWGSGISYAISAGQTFDTIRHNEFVTSLHYDPSTNAIFTSQKFGGIGRIDASTGVANWNWALNSHNYSYVTAIESDDNYLYASGSNNIHVIDKRNGHVFQTIETPRGGYIFSLARDRFNRLWAASYEGLECFQITDGGHLTPVMSLTTTSTYPLTTNRLHNICSDIEANELIVTSVLGINRVVLDDKGNVSRVDHLTVEDNPDLSSNFLWPIAKAQQPSSYWVGSMGDGLNLVKFGAPGSKAEVASYGKAQGAMSGDVESIQVDRLGRVWCAGPGISCFNPATERFRNFTLEDGLQGRAFGTSSSAVDSAGVMWFGGEYGLNRFVPAQGGQSQAGTDVVITRLLIPGEKPRYDLIGCKQIDLDYPENSFAIDFSTLSYGQTWQVSYRYRLKGYDDDWRYVETGASPSAEYLKLPFGSYILEIEAGHGGSWSGNCTSIKVVSHAPWWLSWWALVIYALIVAAIVFVLMRYLNRINRMKAEMALRNKKEQQTRELMDMKMQFFTDVSHEFRTPLTLMRHAVSELSEDDAMASNRYVKVLARNTGAMSNMVNELLDFHRADMKAAKIQASLTSINSVMRTIVDEFDAWAHEAGVNMALTMPEQEIEMWVDCEHFSKIVSNVLANSIHYTQAGGRIDVTVSTGLYSSVTPAFADSYSIYQNLIPGQQLIIRVKDTGMGIDAQALPTIFDRLRRGGVKTGSTTGSGIGLSLVSSLLALHHGGITVRSREGEGTEMVIFLPMTYNYLTPEQKVDRSSFAVKSYLTDYAVEFEQEEKSDLTDTASDDASSLLIVDDNREILQMLSEYFSGSYHITLAENAQQALDACRKALPDLIISDVMMPGTDGFELCRTLKSNLRTCHIPVILLTAMALDENRIEGLESGADAYVAKPFNPRILRATVKNLLARSRRLLSAPISGNQADEGQPEITRQAILDEKQKQMFEKLRSLVIENLTNEDFTVDMMWRELGINRTRLYSFVKEMTGMTLGTYVRKLRLNRAAHLLLSTDMTIAEVGIAVGMDSNPYFTRAFKEQYGITPSDYIKQHSKQKNTTTQQ
ncbi:MAG: response regulator [Bacteroidales bacterium]|nr:response regulator [Bacteroidales bacterium]